MALTKSVLVDYFTKGNKPQNQHAIGLEIEGFVVQPYHNNYPFKNINQKQSERVLSQLLGDLWQPIAKDNIFKGLKSDIGNITLEPGLQLEFSSHPRKNLNTLVKDEKTFFESLEPILKKEQFEYIRMGYHPLYGPEETDFLTNNPRYDFMYSYMPTVGTLGRNMMKSTATMQANLDYTDETDLAKKIQVIACITPFLIYFSASSPFNLGKISDFLSYRTHVWEHTDKYRAGMPKFFFNGQFSIEKYVDYLLSLPVYFIPRNELLLLTKDNLTFLELMESTGHDLQLTQDDFVHHAFTAFPDIRIKQFLEIRCADSSNLSIANLALITGLLYSPSSLEELYQVTKHITYNDFIEIKNHLNTKGIADTTIAQLHIPTFASYMLDLAYQGLKDRKLNEETLLKPLFSVLDTKSNLAQDYIKAFTDCKYNMPEFLHRLLLSERK